MYLAFADFEEQQMKTESAHEIYKKFLAQEGVDPTLVSLSNQILRIQQINQLFSSFFLSLPVEKEF